MLNTSCLRDFLEDAVNANRLDFPGFSIKTSSYFKHPVKRVTICISMHS
jgi:hypothetical protein